MVLGYSASNSPDTTASDRYERDVERAVDNIVVSPNKMTLGNIRAYHLGASDRWVIRRKLNGRRDQIFVTGRRDAKEQMAIWSLE